MTNIATKLLGGMVIMAGLHRRPDITNEKHLIGYLIGFLEVKPGPHAPK